MYRKDYIKKAIDQLAQLLGKILTDLLDLENLNDFQNQFQASEAMLKDVLGITFEELLHLPASYWIAKLNTDFTMTHLAQVADINFKIAKLNFENEEEIQDTNALNQTLLLYKYLEENDTVYVYERYLKMEWIRKQFSLN